MNRNVMISVALLSVASAILVLAYRSAQKKEAVRQLPYYGEKTLEGNDTVYHKVGAFEFTDQFGRKITSAQVKGCVFVAEYFFTTCQGICPVMNKQMERVQQAFAGERRFKILSHTVNPEFDSVPVMLDYALAHHAIRDKWYFLSGDKKALYDLARKGYYLNAEKGDGGPNDFIHTQNFALVDTNGCIRGYYDGTDSADVSRLILDAGLLLKN